ncbi:MAG: helix-hairpin-helix domain-containing protein [Deltaproteobacteria bacterium]|nr:helix-hairpin-helix domain-containing protein [Deltaproteobacteria bacterium]MBW1936600.1 helix-hairpin-helix domain-containing protein [Deltaproteobacteria bacterium]MBW1978139.1 helix-hairpin-helix domain-containing protein [Deltaproteobacteria bacterium]MBW2046688.1 helix-hairpin-helix domain-containing protein [Deltaproteobacteria bacterium]MBW2301010.1 helix-hairpin-helix domain-containing protein [Deltaproteobacteria bacterium]
MLNRKRILIFCLVGVVLIAFVPLLMAEQGQKVNINTASVQEIMQLSNIGPQYAQRVVEYREKNGPFQKAEDIMKVKGIGSKTWELNKDRIVVE